MSWWCITSIEIKALCYHVPSRNFRLISSLKYYISFIALAPGIIIFIFALALAKLLIKKDKFQTDLLSLHYEHD